MKTNFTKSLALGLLCLPLTNVAFAQTSVISFEEVSIPDSFVSISKSTTIIPGDMAAYSFVSGGVTFDGAQAFWGNFTGFDCSRDTDSINETYANDISAIAGVGFDASPHYAVAYVTQMFPSAPQNSVPIGIRLDTDSTQELLGAYFTNTTLTYKYIANNWDNISSYQVIIKGYVTGVKVSDSVVFDLAKKSAADTVLVRDWTFVSFESLGAVDSITFEVYSDDITTFTPFYFAMDQIVIKDVPSSSITGLMHELNFGIAPNPANDYIEILHPEAKNLTYNIHNVSGQTLGSGTVNNAINIQHLNAGTYFIQVMDTKERKQATRIFIKK